MKQPAAQITTDRLPPHSIEAEQGVLGCILQSPNGCITTAEISLGPEGDPFFDLRNRKIWQTIVDLHDKNAPIDLMTISQRLANQRKLQEVGGIAYITSLSGASPAPASLEYFLEIVTEKFQLRRTITVCTEIVSTLYDQDTDVSDAVSKAQTRVLAALNRINRTGIQEHWDMHDLANYDVSNDPNALVGWHDGKATRYLCRGYGAWLIGQSHLGKSSLGVQQCCLFSLQKPFFGIMALRPLRCLIVQSENDVGDAAESVQGLYGGGRFSDEEKELIRERVKVIRCRGKTGHEFCRWLEREVMLWKADMVYVDPLLRFAGIDVSRQDQCTRFLNDWLDPVLAATGVIMTGAHHTGKPKSAKETKDWSIYDYAYAGIGSSELVNWARAISILRVVPDGTFELLLAKRGARAWATHPQSDMQTTSIFLEHDRDRIFWKQIGPPEIKEKTESTAKGRPNKVVQIACMNLFEFCSQCKEEGEGLREICRRLENWLATQRIDIAGGTTRRVVAELVSNGKVLKNDMGLYLKGPNA